MIPPHTVFLLQFAKYRPDCGQPRVKPAASTVAAAPPQVPSERPAPLLQRLFRPTGRLVSGN